MPPWHKKTNSWDKVWAGLNSWSPNNSQCFIFSLHRRKYVPISISSVYYILNTILNLESTIININWGKWICTVNSHIKICLRYPILIHADIHIYIQPHTHTPIYIHIQSRTHTWYEFLPIIPIIFAYNLVSFHVHNFKFEQLLLPCFIVYLSFNENGQ